MSEKDKEKLRSAVRDHYGEIARSGGCCSGSKSSCCGNGLQSIGDISNSLGYRKEELASLPEGANLGLGCGNPLALALIRPGEIILDLGSGGGIDCFLAAQKTGETGRVIGVDMTPDMLARARQNAAAGGYKNVEFRLGEIENLPVADNFVDLVISNCVINLSPDKERVYSEMFRVLKHGGRIAISDIVATHVIPEDIRNDIDAYSGCVAGALVVDNLRAILEKTGFAKIEINLEESSRAFIREWFPGRDLDKFVVSGLVRASKR
ncbi:Methyltransferase type 11 [Candidatus Zixiibacteriota bacterium]|nr:Methyltransferase type 11 [candidate division Zixibacteria bacterium]